MRWYIPHSSGCPGHTIHWRDNDGEGRFVTPCSSHKNGLAFSKHGLFIRSWSHLRGISCPWRKTTVWPIHLPEKKRKKLGEIDSVQPTFNFCQASALKTNQNNIYWSLPISSNKRWAILEPNKQEGHDLWMKNRLMGTFCFRTHSFQWFGFLFCFGQGLG